MKNQILRYFLAMIVATATLASCEVASVGVTVQPVRPVYVRPAPPSERHIWIEGDWVWSGGRYQWHEGYWSVPRGNYKAWEEGRWEQGEHGWQWRKGHWR